MEGLFIFYLRPMAAMTENMHLDIWKMFDQVITGFYIYKKIFLPVYN